MSVARFVPYIFMAALALASGHARAIPAFCWHVRCAPTGKCVTPPNINPTVDYPAPTVPYSVWYNECFMPHCAGDPSGACS
ncbi:hypothetical protein [Methylocystis parvus]|uniref:DUF3551 domain-containing protein n=1 Tax=Methylocystis parvus TaxID=134 RepID=A0A6B8MEG8_9HYPH|nr:hypothetical protein [Methylocystis parvus]QGM99030.1 hypothetical protein F7D14_17095 [Methylocystis parvus]WBK00604.1 hypothetical protein MMG94_02440 [Methylocystis parvus OBBP]